MARAQIYAQFHIGRIHLPPNRSLMEDSSFKQAFNKTLFCFSSILFTAQYASLAGTTHRFQRQFTVRFWVKHQNGLGSTLLA